MHTEKNTLADLLVAEVHRAWSRETVTLADQSGADVPLGTPLALVGGKYTPVDLAGADAAAVTVALLAEDKLAVDADTPAVILARGVVFNPGAVVWPAGATNEQKADALANLKSLGLVAREVL